jgi:hypothetical protein
MLCLQLFLRSLERPFLDLLADHNRHQDILRRIPSGPVDVQWDSLTKRGDKLHRIRDLRPRPGVWRNMAGGVHNQQLQHAVLCFAGRHEVQRCARRTTFAAAAAATAWLS